MSGPLLLRFSEMDQLNNELIYDKGVCRTALATPGLLKILEWQTRLNGLRLCVKINKFYIRIYIIWHWFKVFLQLWIGGRRKSLSPVKGRLNRLDSVSKLSGTGQNLLNSNIIWVQRLENIYFNVRYVTNEYSVILHKIPDKIEPTSIEWTRSILMC